MSLERDSPVGLLVVALSVLAVAALLYEFATGHAPFGVPSDVPFGLLMIAAGVAFYGAYGLERRAMAGAIVLLVLGGCVTLLALVVGPPLGGVGELLVLVGIGLYFYDTAIAG